MKWVLMIARFACHELPRLWVFPSSSGQELCRHRSSGEDPPQVPNELRPWKDLGVYDSLICLLFVEEANVAELLVVNNGVDWNLTSFSVLLLSH